MRKQYIQLWAVVLVLSGTTLQAAAVRADELAAEKDKPFATTYDLKTLRQAAEQMSTAQVVATQTRLPAILPGPRLDPPEIALGEVGNYRNFLGVQCEKFAVNCGNGECSSSTALKPISITLGEAEFPFYMGIAGDPHSKIVLQKASLVVTGLPEGDWNLGEADLGKFNCRPNERYKFVPIKLNNDMELKIVRSDIGSSCWKLGETPDGPLYVRDGKLNTILDSSVSGRNQVLKLQEEHAYFRCSP